MILSTLIQLILLNRNPTIANVTADCWTIAKIWTNLACAGIVGILNNFIAVITPTDLPHVCLHLHIYSYTNIIVHTDPLYSVVSAPEQVCSSVPDCIVSYR